LEWKYSLNHKPLVLYGARQVGKTWLLKEFGKNEFKRTIYINFDTDRKIHSFFKDDISPQFIINGLENYFNEKIEPANTLLIFDEIQECQRAKDSLKYFNEGAPQYYIAAAGSFLGIAGGKFPVGQVNELTLYPMTYYEFLEAAGRGLLAETLREKNIPALKASHELFIMMLRQYFFIGGMPEAVKTFTETGDYKAVRDIQEVILNNYKNDFSKHINAVNIPKVNMLFDSIPFHLAREKKKFIYKEVKAGGRASEYENAMNWLVSTGLVHKVDRTTEANIPLSRNIEREYFKLYMLDVGLLAAKASLDISTFMLSENMIFSEFKGAFAEQFVLQELKALSGFPILYWGNASGKAEVDFIIQYKNEIIPIEVKSSVNTKSQSLSVYIDKYHPDNIIRVSMKNYGSDGNFHSLPLYMIGNIENVI
jgi:predicted AAA+ superfamily ATPase